MQGCLSLQLPLLSGCSHVFAIACSASSPVRRRSCQLSNKRLVACNGSPRLSTISPCLNGASPPTGISQWWHQASPAHWHQPVVAPAYETATVGTLLYARSAPRVPRPAIKCVCNELHQGKLQLSAPGAKNHGFDHEECVDGPHEPLPVPTAAMHSRY